MLLGCRSGMPVTAEADRLLELMRAVPGAALLVDGGIVVAANNEVVEVTAIPRGALVGAPLADLVLPEHRRRVEQLLGGVGDTTGHAEVRLSVGFKAIELAARRLSDRVAVVGVRSMAREIELSAMAGGLLTHDPVTGLPNRYYLLEELYQRLHAAQRRPLACIAIWVDDLHQVGAERGPRAADRILSQVGERIHGRLRSPDLLGRFDTHGFLVLLASDMDREQLGRVALRLREEIAFPVEYESSLLSFTASMAVVPLGIRRPTLDRIIALLEQVGERATSNGGGLLEALEP